MRLPGGENFWRYMYVYSLRQNARMWRTDGRTLYGGIGRAYAQHRAAKSRGGFNVQIDTQPIISETSLSRQSIPLTKTKRKWSLLKQTNPKLVWLNGNASVSITLRQARLAPRMVTILERLNHLRAEPGLPSLSYPSVGRRYEYPAKVGGVNRHTAWYTFHICDDDDDEVKDLLLWILKITNTRNFKRNLYYKCNVRIT